MRPRVAMVLAIVAVLIGGVMLVPAAYARLSGGDSIGGIGGGENVPAPAPTTPPPPTLAAGPVSVNFKGQFFSWALMDRTTGEISGAPNMTATNSTESMIKIWFASDYLEQLGDKPVPAEKRKQITAAIRDSNDIAANALYKAAGSAASIKRMVSTCGLTDTKPGNVPGYSGWWSFTRMSPRDATRLGDCVADGKAAGPKWTKLVLDEMSKVRGSVDVQQAKSGGGKWGIVDGLPDEIKAQGPVSIKNGWTSLLYDGNWHVNCLAVTDKWSLAVMMRYPDGSGLKYGAKVCASVATQLVTPQPGAALKVPQQPVGKL
ncbi:serine hydrolase [Micromonospora sp. RTP1Z1]|uniref:serine hydrolase n=1 Tax=Micromonospora sp. RTP1Z1 TaxID=2994043 RepID=UPI0029C76A55|nr:serine hydrolase [Micromonospora sp. RTP1Z1]